MALSRICSVLLYTVNGVPADDHEVRLQLECAAGGRLTVATCSCRCTTGHNWTTVSNCVIHLIIQKAYKLALSRNHHHSMFTGRATESSLRGGGQDCRNLVNLPSTHKGKSAIPRRAGNTRHGPGRCPRAPAQVRPHRQSIACHCHKC